MELNLPSREFFYLIMCNANYQSLQLYVYRIITNTLMIRVSIITINFDWAAELVIAKIPITEDAANALKTSKVLRSDFEFNIQKLPM